MQLLRAPRTLCDDGQLHTARRGVAARGRRLEVERYGAHGQCQLAVRQVLQPYSLIMVVPPNNGVRFEAGQVANTGRWRLGFIAC